MILNFFFNVCGGGAHVSYADMYKAVSHNTIAGFLVQLHILIYYKAI